MILRTPPPRKRRAESAEREDQIPNSRSPRDISNHQLVIFEDSPAPVLESSHDPPITSDQMLCTYQCRQMVKSEFLDALSSAEKQARDCQSKLETLNADFSKSEAEKKRFRDQFLYAEQELAAAKQREQALQEQFLKEVSSFEEQLKKQIQLHSELEVKFQNEVNLRTKAEASAASAEEKSRKLEAKLSNVSESIECEKIQLQNELVQLKSESKLSVSKISADLERMECRAKHAEEESKLLKDQLEQLTKRLNECIQQKGEMEKQLLYVSSSQATPTTDNSILVKHLQEELRNYESEVREARRLKSSHENVELLKEKLLEEKSRRERTELELLRLCEMELSVKKLEDELAAWKSLVKEIPGVYTADDVPRKFAALQKEVIDSMLKVGEGQARLKQLEVALDTAELDKQNAVAEAKLAKEMAESSKAEIKRVELIVASVSEERDHLKDVVKELRKEKNAEVGTESGSARVIRELEESLARKESSITELENNLNKLKQVNTQLQNEMKLLNERLTNEARRTKSLERESDRLRSEVALLEAKLGHGDFSSANTKVLRMVNTLAVDNEAKQTIEALQKELQKTKEKLQAVEELKKQSADAGLVDSYISGKIMQLKEQIATLEKREERYKTVFADRISVFRRACCELFGYKIVMDDHQRPDGIPVTRFTLQSIYAQSDDEKLEFEYESGNTNILVNQYTKQPEISRQVDIFIQKMNSIPAFTANMTVESFNKRTLS